MSPSIANILDRWADGAIPDTVAALRELPEIHPNDSAIFDLVYEELRLRHERNLPFDLAPLYREFPEHASSVDEFIQCQLAIIGASDAICDEVLTGIASDEKTLAWPVAGQEWLGLNLLELICETPHSSIFLASDPSTGARLVTVKIAKFPTLEPKLQGPLVHPGVMPILSVVGPDDAGRVGSIMPYWGKATIADVIRLTWQTRSFQRNSECIAQIATRACGRHIPECPYAAQPAAAEGFPELVLQIAIQIAQALTYVHRKGVVHCDLKPSNILVTPAGQIVLIDFNLSQGSTSGDEPLGGTLPYMSPSRIEAMLDPSFSQLAPRATVHDDLYSLGVTLFQLATGRLPFDVPAPDSPLRTQFETMLSAIRNGISIPPLASEFEVGLLQLIERLIGHNRPHFDSAESFLSSANALWNRRSAAAPQPNAKHRTWRRLAGTLVVSLCLLVMKHWTLASAAHPVTSLAPEQLPLSGPRGALTRLFIWLHPGDERGWLALGNQFALDGMTDLGAESYEHAETLRDGSQLSKNNLGFLSWKKGELERSESLFSQAILGRQPLPAAHYNRGRLRQEILSTRLIKGEVRFGSVEHARHLRRIANDLQAFLEFDSIDSDARSDARQRLQTTTRQLVDSLDSNIAVAAYNH